jgi:hypothetical protein
MRTNRFAQPNGAFTEYHCQWRESKSTRILELGAGVGHYVAMFRGYGYTSQGIDAIPNIEKYSRGLVMCHDLTKDIPLWQEFPWYHWVMSCEVGEHIPKEHEATYVQNVVKSCSRGAIISWATPNQRGSLHVNAKPVEETVGLFEAAGLKLHEDWTKRLRENIHEKGFKGRMCVFTKERK